MSNKLYGTNPHKLFPYSKQLSVNNPYQDDYVSRDINTLEAEIQNRINFAIMKIDQMTAT